MSKKLRRVLIAFLAVQVAGWVIGRMAARRLEKGDEDSDEFRIAAIMGGRSFHSHASRLSSGEVIAGMGGIDLDLRDATLDPRGATLDLNAVMGGIQVIVPEGWVIDLDAEGVGGRVDTNVTPADELPGDAPRLRIHAVTRMSGALVTTSSAT
jgi:predicted membrane protein